MSGEDKTSTQGQSAPWEAAQPALKTGLGDAQNLYKSGEGFQPYTGSTVVPYSDQSQAGMNAIQNQATSALSGDNPMGKPLSFYNDMFANGGLSADQQGAADQWRTTAGGSELGNFSPAFNNVLKRVQDDTRTGVDLSMSGAGRYGSGVHTDTLGRSIGGVTDRMMVDEYGRQLGRMDTARSSLAGMGQQGITNRFGASEAMPGAWTNSQAPATDLMKVGSMYEDLAGRTMADNQRIFSATRDAPKQAIEWLNSIGAGAGSLGGSQTGSTTKPSPNPFLQLLAGGLGAGSLLGGVF